jgi:hypothetical protein
MPLRRLLKRIGHLEHQILPQHIPHNLQPHRQPTRIKPTGHTHPWQPRQIHRNRHQIIRRRIL